MCDIKYRKIIFNACMMLLLTFILVGCGSNNDKINVENSESETNGQSIDVDLTKYNQNMLYGQVNDMVWEADKYMGKIVKMRGSYQKYVDKKTGRIYYSCQFSDPTACCVKGIEFQLKDGVEILDNYKDDDIITVVGVFHTYEEWGVPFCELLDASLITE